MWEDKPHRHIDDLDVWTTIFLPQEALHTLLHLQPPNWLKFASGILTDILIETCDDIPDWCRVATWSDYAATRYDRVKEQLRHQLRSETEMEREGHRETGWFVEGEQIIVIDSTDSLGRRQFDWKNVPSTLINDEASIGKRVVLHRQDVESFIEQPVGKGRRTWLGRLMLRGRM